MLQDVLLYNVENQNIRVQSILGFKRHVYSVTQPQKHAA